MRSSSRCSASSSDSIGGLAAAAVSWFGVVVVADELTSRNRTIASTSPSSNTGRPVGRQPGPIIGGDRDDVRIVGILRPLADAVTPHLDLQQVGMLEAFDEHPVAASSSASSSCTAGSRGVSNSRILAMRRLDAINTS